MFFAFLCMICHKTLFNAPARQCHTKINPNASQSIDCQHKSRDARLVRPPVGIATEMPYCVDNVGICD